MGTEREKKGKVRGGMDNFPLNQLFVCLCLKPKNDIIDMPSHILMWLASKKESIPNFYSRMSTGLEGRAVKKRKDEGKWKKQIPCFARFSLVSEIWYGGASELCLPLIGTGFLLYVQNVLLTMLPLFLGIHELLPKIVFKCESGHNADNIFQSI